MASLRQVQTRMYSALAVMLALDACLVIYMISPLRPRPAAQQQELEKVQAELEQKRAETAPLMGMDAKLKNARGDLDNFFRDRLPAKDSAIAAELGKLAASNGVNLAGAKYDEGDSGIDGVNLVRIDAGLEGGYLNTVKFINALERDKMFFILSSIVLDQQQGGAVRLRLKLETFRRI